MGDERVVDMVGVEVEHGLGDKPGRFVPFVVFRALTDSGVICLGQLQPGDARQVAGHLMESAARAEYEGDLVEGLRAIDFTDDMIGPILLSCRTGEIRRHTGFG